MPTELDRLGIEVDTEDGRVVLYLPEPSMPPAAALELAARLKSTALRLLPPVTPEGLPAVCVGEVWADRDPRSHEHGQRYRVAELVTTERGFQFAEVDELTTGYRSRIPLRGFRTLEKE